MWRQKIFNLGHEFPELVKLYQPASREHIKQTEKRLGLRLAELDPAWVEFLSMTNGASIMDYCLVGAMSSQIASIAEVNLELWSISRGKWINGNFVIFLGSSIPSDIGFTKSGRKRCVAFLSTPMETSVLPIASSFDTFMDKFLDDVEKVAYSWKRSQSREIPYTLPGVWPLDLKSWCVRDKVLTRMLMNGELDNLYKHDDDYVAIAENALANMPG
jgi:hypothetical protein